MLGLVVCPSRELAKQILETVEHFAECLVQQGMPRIKSCLIIGGTPVNQSLETINRSVVNFSFVHFLLVYLNAYFYVEEFTSSLLLLVALWTCLIKK